MDSIFNFAFDDNFAFGKNFPDILEEFFADSVFERFGFQNEQRQNPFFDEDFFNQFQHSLRDSIFINGFPFDIDSTLNFQFGHPFPGNTGLPEFEKLQKQLQEKFNHQNFIYPDFKSPKQQEEWGKLMQKQQKEKEDLLKEWEEK